MSPKFVYLRGYRNETPVGCAAYFADYDNGTITYQVSVVNPTKGEVNGKQVRDQFNRKTARNLASERIAKFPITINVNEVFSSWDNKISAIKDNYHSTSRNSLRKKLEYDYNILTTESEIITNSVVGSVMAAISTDDSIPSRANKAARRWLRNMAMDNTSMYSLKKENASKTDVCCAEDSGDCNQCCSCC